MAQDWKKYYNERILNGPALTQFRKDKERSSMVAWFNVIEVVDAVQQKKSSGRLIVQFPVQEEYLNPRGVLQGGLQTAMFDVITSWVLEMADGWSWAATASRTLNMSFLRPVDPDQTVVMDCEIVQVGKRLGMVRGTLERQDGVCEHHLYNVLADQQKL